MVKKNLLFNCIILLATCALVASCTKNTCYECSITARGKTYTESFCEGDVIIDNSGGSNNGMELVLTKNDVDEAASEIESIGGRCNKF